MHVAGPGLLNHSHLVKSYRRQHSCLRCHRRGQSCMIFHVPGTAELIPLIFLDLQCTSRVGHEDAARYRYGWISSH